jgi:prevent-host-death family protein
VITIEIPIRELHARTGHYVRKASSKWEVIITDRGAPVAMLTPLVASIPNSTKSSIAMKRKIIPAYKSLLKATLCAAHLDSTQAIANDRAVRDL